MPVHLDLLSRLHAIWGVVGILTGTSLEVLAVGTDAALTDLAVTGARGQAAVWLLMSVGGVLALGGLAMILIGHGLARRRAAGRALALVAALPNLVLVPFGTALGIYTFWVLLNDDARRQFGRPSRSSPSLGTVGPA
jgi:hypothetical protein